MTTGVVHGTVETPPERRSDGSGPAQHGPQIALVDLLDRLLGTGVVLAGDVVISLAGVDLVQVRLHALVTSVRADMAAAGARSRPEPPPEQSPERSSEEGR